MVTMNRREFMKSSLALVVGATLPVCSAYPASGEWFDINAVRRTIAVLNANSALEPFFLVYIHPDLEPELRALSSPKERWKLAYRKERLKLRRMAQVGLSSGEVGRSETIRWCEA